MNRLLYALPAWAMPFDFLSVADFRLLPGTAAEAIHA